MVLSTDVWFSLSANPNHDWTFVDMVNNSPRVDIRESTEESSRSFMPSSSVKADCSHDAEHSAHSAELSVRLGQKVWTFPRWGGRRFVQGIGQIWLCHRGSCCRDGVFLALCSSEWKLLPDVYGESFHCELAGLGFILSAEIKWL